MSVGPRDQAWEATLDTIRIDGWVTKRRVQRHAIINDVKRSAPNFPKPVASGGRSEYFDDSRMTNIFTFGIVTGNLEVWSLLTISLDVKEPSMMYNEELVLGKIVPEVYEEKDLPSEGTIRNVLDAMEELRWLEKITIGGRGKKSAWAPTQKAESVLDMSDDARKAIIKKRHLPDDLSDPEKISEAILKMSRKRSTILDTPCVNSEVLKEYRKKLMHNGVDILLNTKSEEELMQLHRKHFGELDRGVPIEGVAVLVLKDMAVEDSE
jgi:hypothetical protein